MSTDLPTVALQALFGAAVRGSVLMLLGVLAVGALRATRAAVQHRLWTTVLVGMLVVPALQYVVPAWPVVGAGLARPLVGAPTRTVLVDAAMSLTASSRVPLSEEPVLGRRTVVPPLANPRLRPVAILGLYFVIALGFFARVLMAWVVARRMESFGREILVLGFDRQVSEAVAAVGLRRRPRVLESAGVCVPCAVGLSSPVVLLPSQWSSWRAGTLQAVLRHECAHVARHDGMIRVLSLVYRAAFWFNPLAWWVVRHLASLAEDASDDEALAAGMDPSTYAELLLGFAAGPFGQAGPRAQVSMASGPRVERRLTRIAGWTHPAVSDPQTGRLRAGVVTLACLPFVVAALSVRPSAEGRRLAFGTSAAFTSTEDISTDRAASALRVDGRPAEVALPVSQTGPGRSAVVPSQAAGSVPNLLLYIFDLTTLPGEDLTAAVAYAKQEARRVLALSEVGLRPVTLVRVVTIGSGQPPTLVQEFTSDGSRLIGAFDRVLATRAPARVPGASVSLGDSVSTLCQALPPPPASLDAILSRDDTFQAQLAIGTLRSWSAVPGVLLFSNGVARGLLANLDMPRIADVCRGDGSSPAVDFRWVSSADQRWTVAIANPSASPYSDFVAMWQPVELRVAAHQVEAPVSLQATATAFENGYVSLRVQNESPKSIRSLTLAALVSTRGGTRIFTRTGPSVMIPPGGGTDIESAVIDPMDFHSIGFAPASALVGVVAVEFDDGSSWTYDLAAHGGFTVR